MNPGVLKVLRVAAGEIGYQSLNDPLPGSKYGRWAAGFSGMGWLGGSSLSVPWCDLFVSWVFFRAGQGAAIGVGAGKVYAYTVTHREWFRAHSRFVPTSQAQPGDVVFFDWRRGGDPVEHVGVVERNLGGGVLQTIEGNTSSGNGGSQSRGGGVWRRVRRQGITTVCRPLWQDTHVSRKPQQLLQEDEMYLVLVDNQDWYKTDGLRARHITDPAYLKALTDTGRFPLVKITRAQFEANYESLTQDHLRVAGRVRTVIDLLTDYPAMSEEQKKISILRRIEQKLGITPRTN